MLVPPKQVSFLTISNENIFLKTQGTRLGAIVTRNKGLEKALIASLLYCAIIHRSIAYMCYTQNSLFETPGFKRILPQNKLVLIELISQSLVTHSQSAKSEPIHSNLVKRLLSLLTLECEVSVDGALLLWKG